MPDENPKVLSAFADSPVAGWGKVVAIDGPAGVGKTTVAQALASRLGFLLLDSGAIYRAMALHLMKHGIKPDSSHIPRIIIDSPHISIGLEIGVMRIRLGADDVTVAIREESVGSAASRFSARPEVRNALLGLQRSAASNWNLVAEGRDMGTVVFPDAWIKFFLTADLSERSKRRYLELIERGEITELKDVMDEMRKRDERDQSRIEAPLVPAKDAIVVDTGSLSPHEVLELLFLHVSRKHSV